MVVAVLFGAINAGLAFQGGRGLEDSFHFTFVPICAIARVGYCREESEWWT